MFLNTINQFPLTIISENINSRDCEYISREVGTYFSNDQQIVNFLLLSQDTLAPKSFNFTQQNTFVQFTSII